MKTRRENSNLGQKQICGRRASTLSFSRCPVHLENCASFFFLRRRGREVKNKQTKNKRREKKKQKIRKPATAKKAKKKKSQRKRKQEDSKEKSRPHICPSLLHGNLFLLISVFFFSVVCACVLRFAAGTPYYYYYYFHFHYKRREGRGKCVESSFSILLEARRKKKKRKERSRLLLCRAFKRLGLKPRIIGAHTHTSTHVHLSEKKRGCLSFSLHFFFSVCLPSSALNLT